MSEDRTAEALAVLSDALKKMPSGAGFYMPDFWSLEEWHAIDALRNAAPTLVRIAQWLEQDWWDASDPYPLFDDLANAVLGASEEAEK